MLNFNQIKIGFVLVFLNIISCSGQEEIKLTINNFSSHKIDSIVIPQEKEKGLNKLVFNKDIEKGQTDILKIFLDKSNLWDEGSFWIVIYGKVKTWESSWGFHDMGHVLNDTINVYDKGLTKGKNSLVKPKELFVYFYKMDKTVKIDSVVSTSILKEKIQRSIVNGMEKQNNENREIIFDFEKIKETPEFDVWISGKKYRAIMQHDFDDWNNNQEFLYFKNGQIIPTNQ